MNDETQKAIEDLQKQLSQLRETVTKIDRALIALESTVSQLQKGKTYHGTNS